MWHKFVAAFLELSCLDSPVIWSSMVLRLLSSSFPNPPFSGLSSQHPSYIACSSNSLQHYLKMVALYLSLGLLAYNLHAFLCVCLQKFFLKIVVSIIPILGNLSKLDVCNIITTTYFGLAFSLFLKDNY